jgi:hypothetical protein
MLHCGAASITAAGRRRDIFLAVSETAVYVAPDLAAVRARDARLIVARDHGFTSWAQVGGECDPIFELAADAVVLGRIEELDRLLADAPDLVRRRSAYGHRATLLHYTAANAVEIRRQMVPANAAEITARLLDAGADAAATSHAYEGTPDTLVMLKSSAHPRDAGVAAEIESARTALRHEWQETGCSPHDWATPG